LEREGGRVVPGERVGGGWWRGGWWGRGAERTIY
jgi:hypothetical protein